MIDKVLISIFGVCLVLGILSLGVESDRDEKNRKKIASQSAQVVGGVEGDLTTQKENEASKFNENASQASAQNGGASDSAKGVNSTTAALVSGSLMSALSRISEIDLPGSISETIL